MRYTHRTPFTIESINDIQQVSGFKNISAILDVTSNMEF